MSIKCIKFTLCRLSILKQFQARYDIKYAHYRRTKPNSSYCKGAGALTEWSPVWWNKVQLTETLERQTDGFTQLCTPVGSFRVTRGINEFYAAS